MCAGPDTGYVERTRLYIGHMSYDALSKWIEIEITKVTSRCITEYWLYINSL